MLVEVEAVGLNHGELTGLRRGRAGRVPGWDAAGRVAGGDDGGGRLEVGARVAGFAPRGGWAERRVMPVEAVARVPDGVSSADAAALPIPGVTALRALHQLGAVVGRRVLVTGASGGVGRLAVQLARRAGAHVVAVVGSPPRGEGLRELGADEVVVGVEAAEGELHGAIDLVGGPGLVRLFGLLAEGGTLVSVGYTSGEPSTFPPGGTVGTRRRLVAFTTEGRGDPGLGEDLASLLALVERGQLDPQVGLRAPWTEAVPTIEAVLGRRVLGKAVLEVGPGA